MSNPDENSVTSNITEKSGGDKTPSAKNEGMPPEERRKLVLEFLNEHDMALPPLAIFAGLKRHHNITFAYRTVQNILRELVDEGDVFRVDTTKLRENAELVEISESANGRRTYYFITESGRDRITD